MVTVTTAPVQHAENTRPPIQPHDATCKIRDTASQSRDQIIESGSIQDGDTIEVLHNQHPERIRHNGIDCPEKGQAYGRKAKQAASELVYGKHVTLQTHGKDKYGRTLAGVLLPDGMNLNQELVKQGWCWWYRTYTPGDTVLEGLETEAREARKWLWAKPQPVPQWILRKTRVPTR